MCSIYTWQKGILEVVFEKDQIGRDVVLKGKQL